MVIICNGAFKSGSTWVYLIIEEILKLKDVTFNNFIKSDWVSNKNPNFLFTDINVEEALEYYLKKDDDIFLTKSHFLSEKTYINLKNHSDKNLKILFIERDLSDAIFSHYNHVITQTDVRLSWNLYFKFIGKYKAREIVEFSKMRDAYLPNFSHSLKFEDLKGDFRKEVKNISAFLGFSLSVSEIDLVKENTSLSNLKISAKEGRIKQYSKNTDKSAKLFRKGAIGEGEKVISERQKRQLLKVENGTTSILYDLYYLVFFKLRRYLYKM